MISLLDFTRLHDGTIAAIESCRCDVVAGTVPCDDYHCDVGDGGDAARVESGRSFSRASPLRGI